MREARRMKRRDFLTTGERILMHISYWRMVQQMAWPGSGVRRMADERLVHWRLKLEEMSRK